ncbi:MAG: hypothetical protein Q9217_000954 [Psora testacea]
MAYFDAMHYGRGGWKVVVVAALLVLMQILMVCGRLVCRTLKKAGFSKDDYTLLMATVLTFGLCALAAAFPRIAGVAPRLGSGKDDQSTSLVNQSFVAWTIIYGLSIAASKWAILLLYLRVFTTLNRLFNIVVCSMGIIITATAVANTFVAIFQCSPINYAWNSGIDSGTCIDVVAFNRYMAIPNLFTGIIMLIMPLPLILKLNVTTLQKIGLSATFLHGTIQVSGPWDGTREAKNEHTTVSEEKRSDDLEVQFRVGVREGNVED